MEKITVENIEKEINMMLEELPLNCVNLERFVLYSKAKKYLCKEHHGLTDEEARMWVEHMHPAARWTKDQTTAVMHQKGYDHKPCEFWAVMNALVSDYGSTMSKYGADRADVWADLAHDWLNDSDAVANKAGMYFKTIVMHEE
jgi:hypothetical protein